MNTIKYSGNSLRRIIVSLSSIICILDGLRPIQDHNITDLKERNTETFSKGLLKEQTNHNNRNQIKKWRPAALITLAIFFIMVVFFVHPWKLFFSGDDRQTEHHYEFVTDQVYWEEAFEQAKQRGGYLARIGSEEEFDQILKEIEENNLSDGQFYLGARRDPDEKQYYWVNEDNEYIGEVLNGTDSWIAAKWLDGEPSFEWKGEKELYVILDYYEEEDKWGLNDVKNRKKDSQAFIIEYD